VPTYVTLVKFTSEGLKDVANFGQAYYKQIPNYIAEKVRELLDEELLAVVDEFNEHYEL